MVALIFTAIVTPYEIALLTPIDYDALWYLNTLVNVVFFMDMILAFFRAYTEPLNKGGRIVKDLRRIRWNYCKGWFSIDLVSIIPFKYVPGGEGLSILRVIRIVRLLKLLRVLKASAMYKRYEAQISLPHSVVALVKFVLLLVIMAHWMACAWVMTATLQASGRYTWIDNFVQLHGYCDSEDDCPSRHELLNNVDGLGKNRDVYSAALYWSVVTITSVGYGDITPTNPDEMLVCTAYLLFSSCLWAYIIGNATTIVSTGDPAAIAHHQTMDKLNSFMRDRNFPDALKTRLRTYHHNSRDIAKSAGYQQLIDNLSPDLKADVTVRNVAWLKMIYYFQNEALDREFLVTLSSSIVWLVFEPRETIKFQNNLHCVGKGVCSRNGHVKTQGCFWGEDFIMECDDLKDKSPAQTLTFCELLCLSRASFFDVLDFFPREATLVRHATVKMAVRRGILAEAEGRLEEQLKAHGGHIDFTRALLKQIRKDQSTGGSTQVFKKPKVTLQRMMKEYEVKMDTKLQRIENNMEAKLQKYSVEVQQAVEAKMVRGQELFDVVTAPSSAYFASIAHANSFLLFVDFSLFFAE